MTDEQIPAEALPAAPETKAATEPQWKCEQCNGKVFKSKGGLKRHVLEYHPKAQTLTTSGALVREASAPKPRKGLREKVDNIFFRT